MLLRFKKDARNYVEFFTEDIVSMRKKGLVLSFEVVSFSDAYGSDLGLNYTIEIIFDTEEKIKKACSVIRKALKIETVTFHCSDCTAEQISQKGVKNLC